MIMKTGYCPCYFLHCLSFLISTLPSVNLEQFFIRPRWLFHLFYLYSNWCIFMHFVNQFFLIRYFFLRDWKLSKERSWNGLMFKMYQASSNISSKSNLLNACQFDAFIMAILYLPNKLVIQVYYQSDFY